MPHFVVVFAFLFIFIYFLLFVDVVY